MRYGIIEEDGWYFVADMICEEYVAGPFWDLHDAEEAEAKYQRSDESH